jgi:hypothetical protein
MLGATCIADGFPDFMDELTVFFADDHSEQ